MTRQRRRSEATRALILLWVTEEGKLSLNDLLLRLQGHNRRYSNPSSLAQVIRPMLSKKLLIRVSEYPNPEYSIPRD
tara:strand:- start:8431 stop:8661 length:231 start_codon:yes stop_codon:yes gene_type:complete